MEYIIYERPSVKKSYPYVFVRMQAPYKKLSSMYSVCSKLLDKAEVKTINSNSCGVHVCRYTLTHKLLKAKVPYQVITDTLGQRGMGEIRRIQPPLLPKERGKPVYPLPRRRTAIVVIPYLLPDTN